jgi:hypothetical protein
MLGAGPLTTDELAERLAAAGLDLGRDPHDRLREVLEASTEVWALDDDLWIGCAAALHGTAWCTVLDPPAAAAGVLPTSRDLHPLGWWAVDVPLDWGDHVGVVVLGEDADDDFDGLVGPEGWLDGLAGPVLVRIEGRRLSVVPVAEPPEPVPEQVAAVRAAFEAEALDEELTSSLVPGEGPVALRFASLESVVWRALAVDPAAFRTAPVPPVDVLLAAAALERSGGDVAEAGFPWDDLDRWRRRQQLAWMHRLEPDEVDLAEVLIGASLAVIHGEGDPLGPVDEEPRSAQLMAHALLAPRVAKAFWGHHLERRTPPEALERFAARLLAHLDGPQRAGVAWLAGRAADLAGDAAAAEAWFTDAVACGAEHPPALVALAAFRADRGDAPGAMRLLRRALDEQADPFDDDLVADLYAEVGPYAANRPAPLARRNDPCPCGSGRKYKACHQGQERHPLIDRGPWLYAKARRYLRDNRFRLLTAELGHAMTAASGRGVGFLTELLDSELLADVVLCEAGVLEAFAGEREALLPDDEVLTLARWQLAERSVFEVEQAGRDSLDLRDVRTGDRLTVTNTRPSELTRPGTLLLGRPLPIEDTWRAYSGFVPMPLALLDEALELLDYPDPFEVAGLIGRCLAPPTLSNTDGEPLVAHELVWRVPDQAVVAPALVGAGWSVDEPDVHGVMALRLVRDTANQANTIVLTGRLDVDELVLEANSDRRAGEALEVVARLVPDAELVDHDVRSVDEMLAEHRPSDAAEPALDLDEHPEVAELVAQHLRRMEEQWIDEPIPALGGRTPRQAASDPIGRAELERLFASMPKVAGETGMDPDRMRALLGM